MVDFGLFEVVLRDQTEGARGDSSVLGVRTKALLILEDEFAAISDEPAGCFGGVCVPVRSNVVLFRQFLDNGAARLYYSALSGVSISSERRGITMVKACFGSEETRKGELRRCWIAVGDGNQAV